jgi:MICOS complex subunit MIC10
MLVDALSVNEDNKLEPSWSCNVENDENIDFCWVFLKFVNELENAFEDIFGLRTLLVKMQSNEIIKHKYDKTLASILTTSTISLGVGLTCSLLLFKKKIWPVALTTGFGFGLEYERARATFDIKNIA